MGRFIEARIPFVYGGEVQSPEGVELKIDKDHSVKVPLVSLVSPNGVALKKMKIDLSLKVNKTDIKTIPQEDTDQDSKYTRSSFDVCFSKNKSTGDHMHISMEFEAKEQPEGVSRLLEHFTNQIQPGSIKKKSADDGDGTDY